MSMELVLRGVLIGVGATVVLDLWALMLKRFFGVAGASWALVGRWVGHMPQGRFRHENIFKAPNVMGELAIGWSVHYLTGMIYGVLLVGIFGMDWARSPTLLPALVIGILTIVAPFFIMQPGMGAGIAASKTPDPNASRLRSLMAHTVFGIGMYVTALLVAALMN